MLLPEQQRANNPNLCFNWFSARDTQRGGGEVESTRQMIETVVLRHGADPSRIFVTGLSAGGAMTSTMLATHPELFTGGAIIAGLPHGVAASVPEAFDRMRGYGHQAALLESRVRSASDHRGPWPSVSVWHGTSDATVDAVNAAMIIEQWRGLHRVEEPDLVNHTAGCRHRVWHDVEGRAVIEEYAIAGMGHGTPLASSGNEACGVAGPYMLDVDISSTYRIAASWGIVPAAARARTRSVDEPLRSDAPSLGRGTSFDPTQTINGALRAAGLIR